MKNMRKAADAFFLICLGVFLLAVCVITFSNRSETVSYFENRSLQRVPQLTRENLLDGSYFTDWDSFWSDRAAGRSTLIKYHTLFDWKVLHKPVVNDIVITDTHLLPFYGYQSFDAHPDPDEAAGPVGEELSALQAHIRDNGGELFYVGVPGQLTYFRELYPDYLENGDSYMPHLHEVFAEELKSRGIPFVNMIEEFDKAGKPLQYYCRTDHHYSFDGMFYTYQCLMDRILEETGLELPVLTEDDIERITLPNPFTGSRGKKLFDLYPTDEHLTCGVPKEEIPFTREDDLVPVEPSVLDLPEGNEPAGYTVFMGGDHGETIIRTNRPQLPKALVFGDSFTNALETLLYTSFDEMRSLDLRHFQEMTLWEYIEDYQPDIVIYVRDETFFVRPNPNSQFR